MKGRLRQHGLAGDQLFGDLPGEIDCPGVVLVVAISECHKKTGVGDALHGFENPLRVERSGGPDTAPASRRNGCFWVRRALSNWSRTMPLRGTPAFLAAWSSHSARSSGNRTVIVLSSA